MKNHTLELIVILGEMSKMTRLKSKRVTARRGFIVIMMIIAIMATLAGCDGATSTKVVSAEACFSKRKIEIPLWANTYWGMYDAFSYFWSRKTLEQIQERVLKWDPLASVEIWGNQSLFISSSNPSTEKKDYYILYRVEGTAEKFSNKKYCLDSYSGNNFFEVEEREPYQLLMLPYHLIVYNEDNTRQHYTVGCDKSHELHKGATIDDVYNFYHDSGYYEVEKEDNKVLVKKLLYEWPEEESTVNYEIEFPIIMKVFEEDGKSYFKWSCDEDERN